MCAAAGCGACARFSAEMKNNLKAPVMMWGIYPWFPERGIERIHPDSRSSVLEESLYGKVFKLLDTDDGAWVQIEGATGRYKVNPDLYLTVPWPKFDFGQKVRTLAPRSPREGRIANIRWNDKEKRVFYLMECDGMQLSGSYWDDELESISEQDVPSNC